MVLLNHLASGEPPNVTSKDVPLYWHRLLLLMQIMLIVLINNQPDYEYG